VEFFPKNIPFPAVKMDDFLRQATSDILAILQQPSTVPSLQCGDDTQAAVTQIAQLLNRSVPQPTLIEPLPRVVQTESPAPLPRVVPTEAPAPLPRVVPTDTPTPVPSPQIPNHYSKSPMVQPSPTISPNSQNDKSSPTLLADTIINAIKNATTQHKIIPPRQPFRPYNLRPRQNSFKHRATQRLVAQHVFEEKHTAFHIYHPTTGKKQSLDTLLKSDDRAVWLRGLSNECGRLANGNRYGVKGTNTIKFIPKTSVPHDRKVTYASFVCDHRPLKTEKHRV
jgi:hypothetical protein